MATNNLKEHETEVANAIRKAKGTTAKINPQNFAKEISDLSYVYLSGGIIEHGDSWTFDKTQYGYLFFMADGDGDYGWLTINTAGDNFSFPINGRGIIYIAISPSSGTDVWGFSENISSSTYLGGDPAHGPITFVWESQSSLSLSAQAVFVASSGAFGFAQ